METATYKIANHAEGYCKCGHSSAAHGSNGYICCVCVNPRCMRFDPAEPPAEATGTTASQEPAK